MRGLCRTPDVRRGEADRVTRRAKSDGFGSVGKRGRGMYQKLLISAGGGIISKEQQAKQDECATIAIGLGGTGISCLRTLKKEIYTRVQPDDNGTLGAYYRHIQFLAVDTDSSSIGDTGAVDTIDGNTEFFNIGCSDIEGLLRNAHILKQKPSLKWLKTRNTQGGGNEISIMDAEAGAGGIRQIGRLLLMQNCTAFVQKLTNMITEARTGLIKSSNVNIHIFTGMSGGTGAGVFLDVCYLVQHVLEKLGLSGQGYTCGYFFMPDVNKANGVNSDYISINGFASMKELDYCMNFANNAGEWNQEYDGFSIKTNAPPVKLAHLITATDSNGRVRENGYEYAMHVVSDYVMEYIIQPFISEREAAENEGIFSIRSHIANVLLNIDMVKKEHGACYNYCVLGAANAYLPYREITTYLASKIFESFRDLARQLPGEAELNGFIEANALRYDDIFRELRANAPGVPTQEPDWKVLYSQASAMQLSEVPRCLQKLQSSIPSITAKLDANRRVMLDPEPVRLAGEEERIRSLILRVRNALEQLALQASCGPYYASNLLRSPFSADLVGRVREYYNTNSEKLKAARLKLNQLEEKRDEALQSFQKSNFFNQKARAKAYFLAELTRFQQQARIRQHEEMGNLLQEFQAQLEALHRGFFGKFEEVMQNLQATFDANLSALSAPASLNGTYAFRLIRVQDLKESLDKSVESMRLETQVHDFVSYMFQNPESWVTLEEMKLCDTVTRYFLGQLTEFTRRNIVNYLSIKFGVTAPTLLRERIYNDIILPLNERAYPLFWTESFYDIHDAKSMGYLSIPNISEEIRGAAEDFRKGSSEIRIRASWSSDRITIYRFVCGVPLFGYKGVSTYKQDYVTTPIVGSHLYEGSLEDPRDSRTLIDIAPLSCIPEEQYTEDIRDSLKRYDEAWKAGLFVKKNLGNAVEYWLMLLDYDAVRDWMEEAEDILARNDEEDAERHLQSSAVRTGFPSTGHKVIPNNGVAALADLVVRDHVIGSRYYMDILRRQGDALSSLRDVQARLAALVNDKNVWRESLNEFSRALVSGAVFRKGDPYTYFYMSDEATDEQETLTSAESAPFGMDMPLYSAFLTYRTLPEEEKRAITAAVRRNHRERPDEVKRANENLRAALDEAQSKSKMRLIKVSYSKEDYSKIKDFLENLQARVSGGGEAL